MRHIKPALELPRVSDALPQLIDTLLLNEMPAHGEHVGGAVALQALLG